MANATTKGAKAGATTSPVGQILEKLGISRDELRNHTEQMRDFLQKASNMSAAASSSSIPEPNVDAMTTPTRPHNASLLLHTSSSPFVVTPTRPGGPVAVSSPYPSSSPSADNRPLPYTLPSPPYSTAKPSYSYAALIGQALLASPLHRLTLNDIYKYITTVYPYFSKSAGAGSMGWQNSIRHNLSLNPCFVKLDKNGTEVERSMKGSLWAIPDEYIYCFSDGGFRKPQGLPYLGGKRKPSTVSLSATATSVPTNADASKKQKLSHSVTSSAALQALAAQFPWSRIGLGVPPPSVYPPACPSAASSSASSPPPSLAASQSSSASSTGKSDLPDLTNSSSSPPDEEEVHSDEYEVESSLQPAFGMDDDVFLSEPIAFPTRGQFAKTPKPSPQPVKDLLSRVIEARQTRSTTAITVTSSSCSSSTQSVITSTILPSSVRTRSKSHIHSPLTPPPPKTDSDNHNSTDEEEKQHYPQSNLRTPTRSSPRDKTTGRSRLSMEEVLERKSKNMRKEKDAKLPVTPTPFSLTNRASVDSGPSSSRLLLLSAEKTPFSYKGLTMSPRHPSLLDPFRSQSLGKGKKRALEVDDEDEVHSDERDSLELPHILEASPSAARKERKQREKMSRKDKIEIDGGKKEDEVKDSEEEEDELVHVTPKQKRQSSLLHPGSAFRTPQKQTAKPDLHTMGPMARTPRRLVFGPSPNLPAGMSSSSVTQPTGQQQKPKPKPPYSPSLFKTPAATRNIHLLQPYPLYDPYDSPARREDEMHHLLNFDSSATGGESAYGGSPGSFFGQRRGVLYDSPVQRVGSRGGRLKGSALLDQSGDEMEQ